MLRLRSFNRFITLIITVFNFYYKQVVAEYVQCAAFGTCNCGVTVYAGKTKFIYDVCDSTTVIQNFIPSTNTTELDEQLIRVINTPDRKTTYVSRLHSLVTFQSSRTDFDNRVIPGVFEIDGDTFLF